MGALSAVLMGAATVGSFASAGAQAQPNQPPLVVQPAPNGPWVENFNPFEPTNVADYGTQGALYVPLFYFDMENGHVYPWLGQSYHWANHGLELVVQLKPGLKWSNGTPLTAQDVAFTYNLEHSQPALDIYGNWQYLSSVEAQGKTTVVFHFKRVYTPAIWNLLGNTYPVPESVFSKVANVAKFTNPNPVTDGPYELLSFSPEVYTFVKNPYYVFAPEPYIQKVEFPAYTSNTTSNLALSLGKLDWTGTFIPGVQQTFVAKDPQHFHYWFPADDVVTLYLNLTEYPFNQVAFRRAISLAVNRTQLDNIGEYGYEPPAQSTFAVLPGQASMNNVAAAKAYPAPATPDLAKAQALLRSIGLTHKNAQGILVGKNGKPLSFTLIVVSGWTDWDEDCSLIAQQLKPLGIEVTVRELQYSGYYSALSTGRFDMAISWTDPGPTPYYLLSALMSKQDSAPIGQAAPSNWERYDSPQAQSLLQQYASATSPAVQTKVLNELELLAAKDLPAIPLVYGATWYEYSTRHFVGWPSAQNPYARPAPWDEPDIGWVLDHLRPAS